MTSRRTSVVDHGRYADDAAFLLRFLHVAEILHAEAFKQWEAVLQRAVPQMRATGASGALDEEDFTAWREAMVSAGATDQDIEILAVYLVSWPSPRRPSERSETG
jgi:hypothetical protein